MSDKVLHATRLELVPALPVDVPAGARLTPRVRLICPFGCSLKGETVRVALSEDEDGTSLPLVVFRSRANETDAITIAVPNDAEAVAVRLAFDGAEGEIADHAPSEAEFSAAVVEDATVTLAVWGIPSAVVIGEELTFHAGAKSSGGASLAGVHIDIRDTEGKPQGSVILGHDTWPGADDLYWAKATVKAPDMIGRFNWSVTLDGGAEKPGHVAESLGFSFATIAPPERTLTVTVLDDEAGAPLADAQIRLRPLDKAAATIAGRTDSSGIAMVPMPTGTFELAAWKPNYLIQPTTIVVEADQTVTVTAKFNPKKKPPQIWM